MKYSSMLYSFLFVLLSVGLFSCQNEVLDPQSDENSQDLAFYGKSSENCFNFQASADGLPLGCACMPTPMVCPTGEAIFCNFGAKTFPVTIGDYEGFMTSVVTGMEQSGNGALHLTLIHFFESADGNHAFWTNDQVVCAPGNEPSSCLVNDVLDIVGGCGDFEGAYGKFHNHGLLTFDGGAELCPIFYLGGGEDYVPTGTVDANLHGRVCAPGLNAN